MHLIAFQQDNMNALQLQHGADNILRCQATTGLLLAPLITAALRVPIQPIQRRTLYQTPTNIWTISCRRPLIRVTTSPLLRLLSPIKQTNLCASYSTAPPTAELTIHPVFEHKTGTFQYLVADPSTKQAVIIDPVLDYDKCSQTITTTTADALLTLVRQKGYTISRILETHAHADHLTASFYLQRWLTEQQGHKPPVCIGKRIGQVQTLFGERYGIDAEEYEGVFDKLFEDDEEFEIGTLKAKTMHLPGHTPDHLGYQIGGNHAFHSLHRSESSIC